MNISIITILVCLCLSFSIGFIFGVLLTKDATRDNDGDDD